MRQRVLPLVLLGSALAFLASLYLPWFSTGSQGWSASVADMAALVALALAAAATAGLARPRLLVTLSLARGALAMSYFGVGIVVELARFADARVPGRYQYGDGAYLALASCLAAVASAAALRRTRLRRPSPATTATALVGLGLLVSYLLPWAQIAAPTGIPTPTAAGIDFSSIAPAALALWLAAGVPTPNGRLPFAAAAAVTTGAAFGDLTGWNFSRLYGAWIGLGFTLALLAVASHEARDTFRRIGMPSHAGLPAAAAGLLVVALFMPWPELCDPSGRFGCTSTNGWSLQPGTAADVLALTIVGAYLLRPAEGHLVSLVLSIAVFVGTLGFQTALYVTPPHYHWGYGSYVGFAASAVLLLVVALRMAERPALDRARFLLRLPLILFCLAYLAVVIVPWWGVLPQRLELEAPEPLSWLSIAGVVIALYLLVSWIRQEGGSRQRGEAVVLLPLPLLALFTVVLVRDRGGGFGWGDWLLLGLCVALLACGLAEERERFDRLRLPELLRVDRLRLD